MGSSNFGGAIYAAGLPQAQNLSMMIKDSSFMYNKAVINGGAIYADQLDVYDV